MQDIEADPQLRHALVSLCVADAQTGKTIYAHHEQIGLVPASTQKIFTSVAAFDLLGKDYRYKTEIGYDGKAENGQLYVVGAGDPTLGSWRYKDTKDAVVLQKIVSAVQKRGIKKIGKLLANAYAWGIQPTPGGWIWDDIGNYYGAGCWAINWHENQYDLQLQPGSKVGDATTVKAIDPELHGPQLLNLITTGEKGSGDNGFIYLPPYSELGFTQGTIPLGASPFTISGAFHNGPMQMAKALQSALKKQGIAVDDVRAMEIPDKGGPAGDMEVLLTLPSPPLDSIIYWFLKKSINLYGEALIRTMAYEKTQTGTTEKGVELLRNFWAEHGIDKGAVNIIDGSGLSPQNRVTTDAEVKALQYARTRPWFNAFYDALPEYNGMKMKSGSVGGARAYTGYHKQYVFSIIVNNYDGPASAAVQKMYKVLDLLK